MASRVSPPDLDEEEYLFSCGASCVMGCDEVGRGSIAGPVTVGVTCFISLPTAFPCGLRDSKMLTERRRESIFSRVEAWPDTWAIGSSTAKEIDDKGITNALGMAVLRALADIEKKVDVGKKPYLILDGPLDYISPCFTRDAARGLSVLPHIVTMVHGDARCASVAAASVLAKVTRDKTMCDYAHLPPYTFYKWEKNKGYGTQEHRNAVKKYGLSDLHRHSWHIT